MKKILNSILPLILLSSLVFSCSQKFNFFEKKQEVKSSEEFVQGSEDIPLIVGMERISAESLGFDTNAGSIISSSYALKNDMKTVEEFYRKTLPQMGWKLSANKDKKLKFKRENEKLEIEFVKQDKKLVVRFFLSSTL